MLERTEKQRQAVESGDDRVRDPVTNGTYVLIRAEAFARLKDLLETGPLTPQERQAVLAGVGRRVEWDDPKMDA